MVNRLPVGANGIVRPTFTDQYGRPIQTTNTITYSSDNTSIVMVDGNGKITAIGAGSCNITATSGSLSVTKPLTIYIPILSGLVI